MCSDDDEGDGADAWGRLAAEASADLQRAAAGAAPVSGRESCRDVFVGSPAPHTVGDAAVLSADAAASTLPNGSSAAAQACGAAGTASYAAATAAPAAGRVVDVVGDAFAVLRSVRGTWRAGPRRVALVHCVSADLAASRGFAKAVRERGWLKGLPAPRPFRYTPWVLRTAAGDGGASVFHLVTKSRCHDKPSMQSMVDALQALAALLRSEGGDWALVMPRIGCGLDRLTWAGPNGVRAAVQRELGASTAAIMTVTAADQEQPAEALVESLRAAVYDAQVRSGRGPVAARQALAYTAGGLARTLRVLRRRAAAPAERFPWREEPRPAGPVEPVSGTIARWAGDEEVGAALLAEPPPPPEPPPPEPEMEGEAGGEPAQPLPRSTAWWHAERRRQEASPFVAGTVRTVSLRWRDDRPRATQEGHWLVWGRCLRLSDLKPEERPTLLRLLAKDLRSGAIVACAPGDVDVLTPIAIVYHPVTGKARLIHDLRAINARLDVSTARMARVIDALERGAWCAKFDIAQAFRHVGVDAADQRTLAFRVEGVVFRWTALPFGSCQSPEFFANALAAAMPDSDAIVYVDDILIVAHTKEALDAAMVRLLTQLRGGGWRIALEKCFPYACRTCPFLGLVVNLRDQSVRISVAKAQRLRDLCRAALRRQTIGLRDIQRIGGLLAFFGVALPHVGLARRAIDDAAAECERLPGRTVGMKGRLRQELEFWSRRSDRLPAESRIRGGNGVACVATDAAGLPSLGYGGIVWLGESDTPPLEELLGPASRFEARAAQPPDTHGAARTFFGTLPDAMASESSTVLEVEALRVVLRRAIAARVPVAGRTLLWFCDSTAAVGAVSKWRSPSTALVTTLHALYDLCSQLQCSIAPRWVARDLGWQPAVDALSKRSRIPAQAEWSAPRTLFRAVQRRAGWAVGTDLFASGPNAMVSDYATRFPEARGWTDAFSRSWTGLRAWAFPPFSAAAAALRHLCRARDARLLMLVPRETAVPARLRVVDRYPLPPTRLIAVDGALAPRACPHPLDVLEVHSPT